MAEIHFDAESFQSEVIESGSPALVDFWAPWCGPCKVMGPVVEEVAGDFSGRAVVGKVNVDDHPDLASQYGVQSIPTLLFFKGGQEADRIVGSVAKDVLTQKLDALTMTVE